MAIQLPALGLLTLAMLIPILSGGLNLSITYTANMSGLALAWTLQVLGGPDAGVEIFVFGCVLALTVGALSGFIIGVVVAYTRAHPILVSLSMMILMRGIGEFLSRGKDISGFPNLYKTSAKGYLGHSNTYAGIHGLRRRMAYYLVSNSSGIWNICWAPYSGHSMLWSSHQTESDRSLYTLRIDVCCCRHHHAFTVPSQSVSGMVSRSS